MVTKNEVPDNHPERVWGVGQALADFFQGDYFDPFIPYPTFHFAAGNPWVSGPLSPLIEPRDNRCCHCRSVPGVALAMRHVSYKALQLRAAPAWTWCRAKYLELLSKWPAPIAKGMTSGGIDHSPRTFETIRQDLLKSKTSMTFPLCWRCPFHSFTPSQTPNQKAWWSMSVAPKTCSNSCFEEHWHRWDFELDISWSCTVCLQDIGIFRNWRCETF